MGTGYFPKNPFANEVHDIYPQDYSQRIKKIFYNCIENSTARRR